MNIHDTLGQGPWGLQPALPQTQREIWELLPAQLLTRGNLEVPSGLPASPARSLMFMGGFLAGRDR